VTMVQRSSTHIVKSETLMELALGGLYSEKALSAGMTTEKADLTFASIPYRIMADFQIPVYAQVAERDADFYERLTKAGFMLDFGDDNSGLFIKYLRRGSGYYIDVGAAELVASGEVKLKSAVDVVEIKEHAVLLSDGSELPADLIVYATGYGSMNGWAAKIISQDVADKVGKCWASAPIRKRIRGRGKASCATCGSRRSKTRYGFMAEIYINRDIIRCILRSSSKRDSKASPRPFTAWAKFITRVRDPSANTSLVRTGRLRDYSPAARHALKA